MKKKGIKVLKIALVTIAITSILVACTGGGGIPYGRFVRADGMTGALAVYPWLEFSGRRITIPIMGGFGGVSATSNYTFNDGNMTFQLENMGITWRVRVIDNNTLMVDFGVGVDIEFVRE